LTRKGPRVSYLGRHSFGIQVDCAQGTVQSGIGDPKGSCVEQEAKGSWLKGTGADAGLKSRAEAFGEPIPRY